MLRVGVHFLSCMSEAASFSVKSLQQGEFKFFRRSSSTLVYAPQAQKELGSLRENVTSDKDVYRGRLRTGFVPSLVLTWGKG